MPTKIISHSKRAIGVAKRFGWLPGALYTNLRDIREQERVGLIDVRWENYDFAAHLAAVQKTTPLMTVAQDVTDIRRLDRILAQAEDLARYASKVIIVPKDPRLREVLSTEIPKQYVLGFSVPTKYGGSEIHPRHFERPVHLLGGRPDVQRGLAEVLHVVSFDCNRFTLDAAFGDYFDGETFRPHPLGGYDKCLEDSVKNINILWSDYGQPTNTVAQSHGF